MTELLPRHAVDPVHLSLVQLPSDEIWNEATATVSRYPATERQRAVLDCAVSLKHHVWPFEMRDLIKRKAVIDVGCGRTHYGSAFIAMGAASYTGCDDKADPNARRMRSRLLKKEVDVPVSLGDAMEAFQCLRYVRGRTDTIDGERFDVALLHTVTEHLMDIDRTFSDVRRLIRPGGMVWFLHDNFYSWSGHHCKPQSPKRFDPSDGQQVLYADWNHLFYNPDDPNHIFYTILNRIRPDDLRAATERYFKIQEWDERRDSSKVLKRLTPDILARACELGLTERDLSIKHIVCTATRD